MAPGNPFNMKEGGQQIPWRIDGQGRALEDWALTVCHCCLQVVSEDLSGLQRVTRDDWPQTIGAVHEFDCNV